MLTEVKLSEQEAWQREQAEAVFKSNVPLGVPVLRGHVLPAELASGQLTFGVAPKADGAGGAKAALSSVNAEAQPPAHRQPGYQGARYSDADWAHSAQPRDATFGQTKAVAAETAASVMAAAAVPPEAPVARAPVDPSRTFGVSTAVSESALASLRMDPEVLAAAAAADARAAARKPPPPSTAFGASPARSSDAPIASLVAPTAQAALALEPPLGIADMDALLRRAGCAFASAAEFEALFARAAAQDGLVGKARLSTVQALRFAKPGK